MPHSLPGFPSSSLLAGTMSNASNQDLLRRHYPVCLPACLPDWLCYVSRLCSALLCSGSLACGDDDDGEESNGLTHSVSYCRIVAHSLTRPLHPLVDLRVTHPPSQPASQKTPQAAPSSSYLRMISSLFFFFSASWRPAALLSLSLSSFSPPSNERATTPADLHLAASGLYVLQRKKLNVRCLVSPPPPPPPPPLPLCVTAQPN